jgi:hypothetical protein
MGSFTDYSSNATIGMWFGGTAVTPPATLYFRLTTTTPTRSAAGTQVSTGSWTNYAPIAVTNNTTNFPAPSSSAGANGTSISFGTAATTGDISVAGIEVYDASSGGNRIGWAAITKTVQNGDPVSVAIGDLGITMT